MADRERFDQLPKLMRLSSANIYRLVHLSGNIVAWHKATLTDFLRAHLIGLNAKSRANVRDIHQKSAAELGAEHQ